MALSDRESFYVYLPSNVSVKGSLADSNNAAEFTVPLAETLYLDDDWEVGLAEIFIPGYTYNVAPPWNQGLNAVFNKKIYHDDSTHSMTRQVENIKVSKGSYDPLMFTTAVNRALGRLTYEGPPPQREVRRAFLGKLKYEKHSRKIAFALKWGEGIQVSDETLRRMLGFTRRHPEVIENVDKTTNPSKKSRIMRLSHNVNFDINGPHMYVYLDIIEYSQVGKIRAPLARVVRVDMNKGDADDSYHIAYEEIHYHPLKVFTISFITVRLCNTYGENMPFVHGSSMLVLHFRRRQQQQGRAGENLS